MGRCQHQQEPDSTLPSPPAEIVDDDALVTTLRREVVAAELQILELKDRMLAVNTDRADAVALLGQAELLLEQKISYIITLDQALNSRIRELEAEADRKTAEIDRRGERIAEVEAQVQRENAARDSIIADLSQRLETANQEINRVHELARELDQKRASAENISATLNAHLTSAHQLQSETSQQLETTTSDLAEARSQIAELNSTLDSTTAQLDQSEASLGLERSRLQTILSSALWRLGRPWRALFGPKIT